MPQNSLDILVQRNLDRSLSRISLISTGRWRAAMVNSYSATPRAVLARYAADPSVAVFMKLNELPLGAVMLLRPEDVECVSRGFTGHSFPASGKVSKADEIMLTELGNILLNAAVDSLLNALKKSALPAIPLLLEGAAAALAERGAGLLAMDSPGRAVSAALSLECEGLAVWTLHVFVPEDLAREIEARP